MKVSRQIHFTRVLLAALVVASVNLGAQEATAPSRETTSSADSAAPFAASLSCQYEAMGKYPELARAGSPFNQEYIARVQRYISANRSFFHNERWPVLLADEVAAAGFPSAVAVIISNAPQPGREAVQMPPDRSRLLGRTVAAPVDAPPVVQVAVEAGNLLQNKPYKWGGGHARLEDSGYDCSGSVSYVLRKAGLLDQARTSSSFASYGHPGPGRWITIYAGPGHAFMTVCGLRLDTGGRRGIGESGPRWNPVPRYASGFVARHPPGF